MLPIVREYRTFSKFLQSWVSRVGVLAILCLVQQPVWGYEQVDVAEGGTLTGKVTLKGSVPPSRIFHLVFSPNIDFCSRISDGKGNRLLREFQVAEGGGFQNVIVAVVGVKQGKKFDFNPQIHIENCRLSPFVTPVRNYHPITIVNKDPIVHDLQGYSLKDDYTFAMFNKPMLPESAATRQIRFRESHYIFRTQCGVHDFMQSWGMAVGNPYFAVTGPDGGFEITDLPAGTYDVIAWHPHMQVQTQQVIIAANGTMSANFEFNSSEVEIPLHDLQTDYRLETWLARRLLIPPSVELQVP